MELIRPNAAAGDLRSDAHSLDQQALQTKYPHEAAEHRRILFSRGTGIAASWRSFRQFLLDLGPAPGDDYLATRLSAADLTYSPGRVTWVHRDRQPALVDRWLGVQAKAPGSSGQWVSVRGKEVEYTTLAKHLGVPFAAMDMALKNNRSPDDLVQQAAIGDTLVQIPTPWLAPERRDAFLAGFRMWHMLVHPRYAAAATPSFLYLYSALPIMLKAKRELETQELWSPTTQHKTLEREDHPAWKRFFETMTRVESARQEFALYRQYSLMTQLEEFWSRVNAAEERFRSPGAGSEPALEG